jgi:CheY-like chemotaxis protein
MPRILLVEDDALSRDVLSRRLARQGFSVAVAEDGKAALEAVKSATPDLVLMDLDLPIIDGWEATRRIKADESTRAIPVIALTAHAMTGDREKAREAGCDDYDTKPVDFARLTAKIRALLPAGGGGA